MKIGFGLTLLAFVAMPASAGGVGPTEEEFNAALVANCSDHSARAKAVRCKGIEEEPTEFECRYKLPKVGGGWKKYVAYVAIDGANWVWLDGETRCYESAISELK